MPAPETIWRSLRTMHIVFALSALALLGATVLMMAADHRDEWRDYQKTAERIRVERLEREIKTTRAAHEATIDERKAALESAEEELKSRQDVLEERRQKVKAAQVEVDITTQQVRDQRAIRDVARANYDLAIRDARPEEVLTGYKKIFDNEQQRVNELELELEQKEQTLSEAQAELAELTKARDEAQAALKKEEAEIERLVTARNKLAPESKFSAFKRDLMELPIIDGFNSHLKVTQDWLPDLKIKLGMASTARFDRCRTCHVNIDAVEAGNIPSFPPGHPEVDDVKAWVDENKFPHPYSTHPHPDLYLTASSPHPVAKFGCTICHSGQGSGTSFSNAAHLPNDPHAHHEWEEKYGFATNHFWEYPMHPERLLESTCIKCHHSVVELGVSREHGTTAPKVVQGYNLVKQYGCFGCHEIHGFDAGRPIGPDLRLEPNYFAAAKQLLADPAFENLSGAGDLADPSEEREDGQDATRPEELLAEMQELAETVITRPADANSERARLQSLVLSDRDSKSPVLTAQTHALVEALKEDENPGDLRKVGPSLRHIASKTTQPWVEYWTEEPKRFRPSTNMPQFFKLSNQQDPHAMKFQPVELAGIAEYLFAKSQPFEVESPEEGYEPDAERGKALFAQRGCLACHSHEAFPGIKSDFGPSLNEVAAKIKPGEEGFGWVYTWIRNPQLYHPRSKMPDLFLDPTGEGDSRVDPAADIAAFLLAGERPEYKPIRVKDEDLDQLVKDFLAKVLTNPQVDQTLATRRYPFTPDQIKGDEIELAREAADASKLSDDEWKATKLRYIGRRTISRYGCYGCHDIPGFEAARPIGTVLQDWGRKDTSRLAFEHIEEYLHHHGEPDGSSTADRVSDGLLRARSNEFKTHEDEEQAMSAAFFYESILHHGRPGFIWQKLREPRSYDYEKVDTKGYDERLRMPKFPLNEQEIEAIATFILGLVADPPAPQYLYQPSGPQQAIVQGEKLLEKFNCVSCHMVDMPKVTYAVDPEELPYFDGLSPDEHAHSLDLLLQLKPPREGNTGRTTTEGEAIINFHGLKVLDADPEEDPEDQVVYWDIWETLQVDGKLLRPSARVEVPVQKLVEATDGRGGPFALWLVAHLLDGSRSLAERDLAWQKSPPPLYLEGHKVQTPWLYSFLKEPYQLRHTTVLRMPRFNMSDAEARALANYFAAVDGADYPYQEVAQRTSGYLAMRNRQLDRIAGENGGEGEYIDQAWQVLNNPGLCIKCHSVGGRDVQVSDPKTDIRGPDLKHTHDRLRPDWLLLWLYSPKWITPYTSMPAVFSKTKPPVPDALGGDANAQAIGVRDALMNYYRLMDAHGIAPAPSQQGRGTPEDTNAEQPNGDSDAQ